MQPRLTLDGHKPEEDNPHKPARAEGYYKKRREGQENVYKSLAKKTDCPDNDKLALLNHWEEQLVIAILFYAAVTTMLVKKK